MLLVADTVYTLVVMGLLLWLKISARMRNIAQNITRSRFWQVPIYFVLFLLIITAATFPLALYESFFREHAYGLSNQTFVQWLGDFGISFAVTLVLLTIAVTLLYGGHPCGAAQLVALGHRADHRLPRLRNDHLSGLPRAAAEPLPALAG